LTMISLSRPQEETGFEDEELNLKLLNGYDVSGGKVSVTSLVENFSDVTGGKINISKKKKHGLVVIKLFSSSLTPGACTIKLFTSVIYGFRNKLECLSLASLFSLVKCLRVRPEPTQVKHLKGAPL
jgi:hypothetical protein